MRAGIIYGTTDQKTAENLIKGLKQGQSIEEITWIDDDGLYKNWIPEADDVTAFEDDVIPFTINEYYHKSVGKDQLQDIFLPTEFDLDESDDYCLIFRQRKDGYQNFFKRYQKALKNYAQATKMVGTRLEDNDMYERLDKLPHKQQEQVIDAKITLRSIESDMFSGRIVLLDNRIDISSVKGMDQQLVSSKKLLTYYMFPQQVGSFHF